jgi:hypothetical protein
MIGSLYRSIYANIGRSRRRIWASLGNSPEHCLAGLEVRFAEVPVGNEKRKVCVKYLCLEEGADLPSPEHCPSCKYNPENIRAEADNRLKERIIIGLTRMGYRF